MSVRLVAWNCRVPLSPAKLATVDDLAADVMVTSEVQSSFQPPAGWSILRRDTTMPRALAVMVRPGWSVALAAEDPALPWLLTCDVRGPGGHALTFLAVWTIAGPGHGSCARQTQRAVRAWAEACALSGRDPWAATVLAGDLNAGTTTEPGPHDQTLRALDEAGMVSAYFLCGGCLHGEEAHPTLRWAGAGKVVKYFHCDFVFVSSDLNTGLRAYVGAEQDWIGPTKSDHAPIVVDLPNFASVSGEP